MLTIQGFKNLALKKNIRPESIIYMLAGNIKKISEKNFLFSTISQKSIDGYPAMIALIGCANLLAKHVSGIEKGQGEIGLYLCIKGNKDMYLVHKSWKIKGFNEENLPINKAELKKWINLLSKTEIIEKTKVYYTNKIL